MNRKLLVNLHLYFAAFFTPAVLLVAVSGGLYLVGVKGTVTQQSIYKGSAAIDGSSPSLRADVAKLLTAAGVESYTFEYVKVRGDTLYTRPTSSDHYIVKTSNEGVEVIQAQPNLQSRMIELHKGHGPSAFKTFQKVFAVGLLFIMLSGVLLGLTSAKLLRPTFLTVMAGAIAFGLLLI